MQREIRLSDAFSPSKVNIKEQGLMDTSGIVGEILTRLRQETERRAIAERDVMTTRLELAEATKKNRELEIVQSGYRQALKREGDYRLHLEMLLDRAKQVIPYKGTRGGIPPRLWKAFVDQYDDAVKYHASQEIPF